MEMLLSTMIGGIVLTSAFDLYVMSSKTTQGHSDTVQMQLQLKSAMDLMSREMQLMYGSPTISTTLTANDTINFKRIVDSGYATGSAMNCNPGDTMSDTRKNWEVNAFAPSPTASYAVTIISGAGFFSGGPGQALNISGNSAIALSLPQSGCSANFDTTSLYVIYRNEGFTLTAANKLGYQRGGGAYNPIAENITNLAFSQPDSTSITIALTGRTSNPDPHTGRYNSYSLTDTVMKRN
jgi:hypothetical protein